MSKRRIRMALWLCLLAGACIASYMAQPRTKLLMVEGHLCELYETYYDNGHPLQRYFLIHAEPNAVNHGIDNAWYSNGNLRSEVHYNYGEFDGRMRTWWPSGNLQWEAHFAHDKPHGSFQQWFDNEQMRTQRFFNHGACEGRGRVWYANGQLRVEFNAQSNNYHGVRRVWNEAGQLRAEQNYENGTFVGEWTVWGDSGDVLAKGVYIDGEPCEGTFAMLNRQTEDLVVYDVENDGMVVAVLPGSFGDVLPHKFATKSMWNLLDKEPQ